MADKNLERAIIADYIKIWGSEKILQKVADYLCDCEDKTLVIKQITNEAWSDETKARGVFFIEEKNRDKKGITLTKSDCGKLAIILKEISEQ